MLLEYTRIRLPQGLCPAVPAAWDASPDIRRAHPPPLTPWFRSRLPAGPPLASPVALHFALSPPTLSPLAPRFPLPIAFTTLRDLALYCFYLTACLSALDCDSMELFFLSPAPPAAPVPGGCSVIFVEWTHEFCLKLPHPAPTISSGSE